VKTREGHGLHAGHGSCFKSFVIIKYIVIAIKHNNKNIITPSAMSISCIYFLIENKYFPRESISR
jgi:hypothetical protein